MMSRHGVWMMVLLAVLACQSCLATDKPADATDKVDKPAASTSTAAATSTSQDLGIPQNLVNILTNGGAVAVGLAVVAALAALAMPMFGMRYCQLLGNCDASAYPYAANSAVYQNDVYGQYPQTSYPTGNTYQKRSLDYMGPVIQMLKTAYDKYGQASVASRRTS